MTDLHATAAELIVDVHDGRLIAPPHRIRALSKSALTDLVMILARHASPDDTLRAAVPVRNMSAEAAVDAALRRVCAHYELDQALVLSASREDRIVTARHLVCWLARDASVPLSVIGNVLNRNHTSVMYAVRKVANTPALLAMARVIRDGTKTEGAA